MQLGSQAKALLEVSRVLAEAPSKAEILAVYSRTDPMRTFESHTTSLPLTAIGVMRRSTRMLNPGVQTQGLLGINKSWNLPSLPSSP